MKKLHYGATKSKCNSNSKYIISILYILNPNFKNRLYSKFISTINFSFLFLKYIFQNIS